MSQPVVTVAVVSWNTRELLAGCLRSLQPDAEAGRAEVWVADNGSTDGSAEMVERDHPWVTLVRGSDNIGFGRAVNLVAERSGADWIAPANADVELEPGALEALLRAGEADPAAGAVAPRLVLPDGSTQHSVYSFPTLRFTAAFNLGLASATRALGDRLLLEGHWDPERPRRVDWAIGAFLVVRRSAWDAIGGFDPGQWLYAEDLDLGWRLARAGRHTRYEPRAVVRHHSGAAAAQAFGDDRRDRWMAATYAWMAARRGPAVAWTAAALNLAGTAARLGWLVPAARVAPGRFAARRDVLREWLPIHARGLRPSRELLERRRPPPPP